MKRTTFFVVLGIATLLWAFTDLYTKHLVQLSLATPDHLLPLNVSADVEGHTLCELLKSRFSEEDCTVFRGSVIRIHGPLAPTVPLKELSRSYAYLFAFPEGDTKGFAMRIPLVDRESGRTFQDLEDALKSGLGLRGETLKRTLEKGIWGMKRSDAPVSLQEVVHSKDMFLLSRRVITIIPGHLDLSYVENPAGAWGMLGSLPRKYRKWVFYIVTIIAFGVVGYLIIHPPSYSFFSILALSGILGGAIGNLVDRMGRGVVVDFIHMYWGRFHWPNYNVADIGITVGLIILLAQSMFSGKHQKGD